MFAGKMWPGSASARLFAHLYKKWVSVCVYVCVRVCSVRICVCLHAGGQSCNIMCIWRYTGCRVKTTRDLKQIFGELIQNGKQTPRGGASLPVNKRDSDINTNILIASLSRNPKQTSFRGPKSFKRLSDEWFCFEQTSQNETVGTSSCEDFVL